MKKELLEKIKNTHSNIIVEGGISSGKTNDVLSPIVESSIKNKESLFILDSKEEYLERFYDKLKSNGYNTVIINLRDLDKSEGWNPLEYPAKLFKEGSKDKAQEYLEKIGNTIFYEESNQDPFWNMTAANLFTGVCLALFEDAKDEEINFSSINNMFYGFWKKNGSIDCMTKYFRTKSPTSMSYILASSTVNAPSETKGSIISAAQTKIRVFTTREKLNQLMSKTTFNIEDVLKKPTAIFFIARDDNRVLNDLAAMFIEQLYLLLVNLKSENRFNLILDNFDVINRLNNINEILSSCVSRNIYTYIATYSVDILEKKYGDIILRLCNTIDVDYDKITVTINRKQETYDKEEKHDFTKCKVEYPTLKNTEVKLFDYEKFINGVNSNITSSYSNVNIDEYIKKLDEKIAKLEGEIEEEKKETANKSDLDKFKTDNI